MENTTNYEMTFIIGGDVQEFDVQKLVTKVQDSISARGGHVLTSDMWGKQRLAYPIGKHEFGYYTTLVFSHPGTTISEFEQEVRIMPEVIRHLIISLDKENLKPEQIKKIEPFKDQAEYRAAKFAAAEAKFPSRSPRPTTPSAPAAAPKVSDKDEATRLKELDEKLSGLLDEGTEAPVETTPEAPAEIASEAVETPEEPKEE